MTRSLADWLEYQQRQHPRAIALGLERVRAVAGRLGLPRPAPRVVTVGGTNGKGSCVAMLEAMLRAGGLRVGAYTSPHLLRYGERIRIEGREADEASLVAAFEAIESARGVTPLTFFEYGTLAALLLFARANLDVAVLEVGLGGRLDAVNLVDADVALITAIGLDHQDWLGPDRESIGREKAGIMRPGRPALVADPAPPQSVLAHAAAVGAALWRVGSEWDFRVVGDGFLWRGRSLAETTFPRPPLAAPVQVGNAAACLAVLEAMGEQALIADGRAARGLAGTLIPGRLQRLARRPDLYVDVAHNPQAAAAVAEWLATSPRRTLAVYGALGDKDVAGVIAALAPQVAEWHLCGLHGASPRGLRAAETFNRGREALRGCVAALHPDPVAALAAARRAAGPEERILAFGSFHTVEAVIRAVEDGTDP
jgi:dihydrofolate synthase/folylpolyglutamate synthase